MRNKGLKQSTLKDYLFYDRESGVFCWIKRSAYKTRMFDIAGTTQLFNGKEYVMIQFKGEKYLAHRLAWLYVYGRFPKHEIDHINGDGTDNRIENLRTVTRAENKKNRKRNKNNSSGCTGVYWYKPLNKWLAQIQSDGHKKALGYHESFLDACAARKSAEHKYNFHENHGRR